MSRFWEGRVVTAHQSKLIGLLGGMSWESSALYYRLLNTAAHRRLGGHHNARSLLFTLDFDELNDAAAAGRWDIVGDRVADAARRVEAAGAAFVMITAVTAHTVADRVQAALKVPLLHIADPTAAAIQAAGLRRVGLIGTRYTMELDFFRDRLRGHGFEVITPDEAQRTALHRAIIDELTVGKVEAKSQQLVLDIAADLAARGAEALAVACTELPLLHEMSAYPLPAFDVTALHAEAAVAMANVAE